MNRHNMHNSDVNVMVIAGYYNYNENLSTFFISCACDRYTKWALREALEVVNFTPAPDFSGNGSGIGSGVIQTV